MYVCVCMCVCACMHVCVYVCACMHVCVYVCPCMHACMRVFMCVTSDLWCDVVWSSTEGSGLFGSGNAVFAQAKVCNLHMTAGVQQDVVQLQVSVDDPKPMHVEKSQHYLRCIEPGGEGERE